jgi:hypothetical protein
MCLCGVATRFLATVLEQATMERKKAARAAKEANGALKKVERADAQEQKKKVCARARPPTAADTFHRSAP